MSGRRLLGCAVASALAACVHVPPHPPIAGTWAVTTDRRHDQWTRGELCNWEAEQLTFGGLPLWVAPPPEGEGSCPPGVDYARSVDVVGEDGRFLSTVLREQDAARGFASVRCVTWDLVSRAPATLDLVDERHAAWWRAAASAALVADPTLSGWLMTGDGFVVRDRHVAFCLVRGDEVRELPIR